MTSVDPILGATKPAPERNRVQECLGGSNKHVAANDWFVMADPDIVAVFEGPEVDGIAESCHHLTGGPEVASALGGSPSAHRRLRAPATPIGSIGDRGRKLATRCLLEHPFHNSRFAVVDDQLLRLTVGIVAVRHCAGDPPPSGLQLGPSTRNS